MKAGKLMALWSKKRHSLSIRIPVIYISSIVIIAVAILTVTYLRFHARMIDEYTRMAAGATKLMAEVVDPDRTEEYMEQGFSMPGYQEIYDRLASLLVNYPDTLYMYIYRFEADGAHVVFDVDNPDGTEQGDQPGHLYGLDPDYEPYLDELCQGEPIPVITSHTADGYLLSYVRPLFDKDGNYACHACVDFSMDYLRSQDIRFVMGIFLVLLVAGLFTLFLNIALVRMSITGPIHQMIRCAGAFQYDTEENRFGNVQKMEELNLYTNDEIGEIYQMYITSLKESMYYMTNLQMARNDLQERDKELGEMSITAYRDELTGVGNKNAYRDEATKLSAQLEEGFTDFAILMVDVNNLKYVNDNFGHENGDSYIKGCCNMVCTMYKHSPVFRIGGDEFAVILQNTDYNNRATLLTGIREAFKETAAATDVPDWERYSAAVGMAQCSGADTAVQEVLRRADEDMYRDKEACKKASGRSR